jgi:hypothetical protein
MKNIEFAKCNSCKNEYVASNSKYLNSCSQECYKASKKVDIKLSSLKTPKKKCKICKSAFEPKNNFIPVCDSIDCKTQYAMSVVEKQKIATDKKKKSDDRKYKIDKNIELMSPDKYRAKILQPAINEIARLIDFGQACIATGSFEGKMAGGHFIAVAANRTICLNLHNIFIQSFHSNSWKGGDNLRYREGIRNTFGQEYLDFMEGLQRHPKIGLSKNDMIEVYENACKIRLKLRKNEKLRSPKERIELRNQINLELGIYQEEYCIFNY